MKIRALSIAIFLLAATVLPSYAQNMSIASGINWLSTHQNVDGSWGANASTDVVDTAEVINAKIYFGNDVGIQNSVAWLIAQDVSTIDETSRKIIVSARMGEDTSTLVTALASARSLDAGWGYKEGYPTNPLDTALALQALKAANYADQAVVNAALAYLTGNQNSDGGWGFYQGDASNVYMTAVVSATLQQFPQTTTVATALNKATNYLLINQNSDGGFGSPSSTVHETALAYTALVAVITDATALGKAVGFLTTNQSADGSWLQDPYSTALALRALHYSEYRPTLPLPPTTGTLAGKVVSAATREPLAGVTVSLAKNPVIAAMTDSAGTFKLDNIPQGSQQIALSLSGYATSSLLATVTAGGISNLGTLTLTSASSSGVIQGMIVDEATGLPLAGVFITLYPPLGGPVLAAVTSTNGTYRIDIAPEHYGIAASKEGYATIHDAWTISAGDVIDFSPVLPTNPPSSTTSELMGRVVDDSTSAPVAGAVVTMVGAKTYTTSTNASGYYHILNIDQEGGGSTLKITAYGYRDWYSTYTLTFLEGDINYQRTQRLSPEPFATTVSGKVTDSTTDLPIAGAEVYVTGTTLMATTDDSGTYTIQGITQLNFELEASAPGHFGKSYILSNQYHGDYTVDFALVASRSVYAKIASVSTDKEAYPAYADVVVAADILNTYTVPVTVAVTVSILNAQGEIVANLPVTEPDANGHASISITFQPDSVKTVHVIWGTGARPPGDYSVIVKIVEDTSVTGLDAMVVAQQSHKITIEPTQAIDTLAVTPLPRFTNLGATEQIGLQATLINRSNVPTTVVFTYDWKSSDGTVLRTGSGTISAQPEEASKSLLLESFPFIFPASGEYPLQMQITSGPIPTSLVGGTVSVAPGIRIEPSQSVTPATVIPDGDKRIRMNIRLKGVMTK